MSGFPPGLHFPKPHLVRIPSGFYNGVLLLVSGSILANEDSTEDLEADEIEPL